jgi:type III secretion protein Q
MTEALRLRQMSAAQMVARNILYRGGLQTAFLWLGHTWECRLRHVRTVKESGVRLVVDWGGAEIALFADLQWLESATEALLQASDVSSLPDQLRLALVESAMAELADQLETAGKKPIRIKSLVLVNEQLDREIALLGKEAMAWDANCGGIEHEGALVLDAAAMVLAAASASGRGLGDGEHLNLQMLPIRVQFVIGTTSVPLSGYTSLQTRDVILLDDSFLHGPEMLTVMVSDNAAFRARLSGTQLVVTEGLHNTMDESCDDNEYAMNQIVSELPIKLTFDLGERVLSLGELQMVAPGYVFDLGRDLRQCVTIRANGMRIGEGELVDIEGRTGVAVLSITGQPE